jgi:hypothetical protein
MFLIDKKIYEFMIKILYDKFQLFNFTDNLKLI